MSRAPSGPSGRDRERALRRDVRELGAELGRVLRRQGTEGLFDRVEAARRLAIARRRGTARAEPRLAHVLTALDPGMAGEVARAFAMWFGVVNTAELVQRLRTLDARRRQGIAPRGSSADVLERLSAQGLPATALVRALERTVVEPVITAHPTEALRRTLLRKESRIARALLDRGPKPGHGASLARIREELTLAWQTEEHRHDRPTVADELEHSLHFLGHGIWAAAPRVLARLRRSLQVAHGRDGNAPLPRLRLATWVGGDMDGNPSAGPATIRASCARHAELAVRLHLAELERLFERLSQSDSRVRFSEAFLARLDDLRRRTLGHRALPARFAGMLHREFLWRVRARLERSLGDGDGYRDPRELEEDVSALLHSVAELGGRPAGLGRVQRLLDRVRCFGLHLASLDVRRDSLDHRAAIAELLGIPGFAELAARDRQARILAALRHPPDATPARGQELERSLAVLRAVAEARGRHGKEAIGLFVLSMAQGPDDVLAALLLARCADAARRETVELDIAPLFETVVDLETAPDALAALLSVPSYRAHLATRSDRQWVMLGYSDSNKSAGMIASRVALQEAQRRLVLVARAHGVELALFHGRGGSLSRGGSKPRDAILASPAGAVAGRMRVTEQGEMVRTKFGLVGIAERTLDLLVGATLERTALDEASGAQPEATDPLALELAAQARLTYERTVGGDPDLLEYFRAATPIDVIERLSLGSRPARRREMRGVRDLRAIPWVFAWTQSRLLLPGWYGSGAALQLAIERHGLKSVQQSVERCAFLQVLLADIEMVLAKSDLGIARRYSELAGERGQRVFADLTADHAAAVDAILRISGSRRLLDRDPRLQRSIELRNPYVDPISFLQVDLLARWRAGGRENVELERALFATVRGIARGMQNTG